MFKSRHTSSPQRQPNQPIKSLWRNRERLDLSFVPHCPVPLREGKVSAGWVWIQSEETGI